MAPKRPTLAESTEKPRALVCAFTQVPGASAVGVRAEQFLLGFSDGVDIDALTLKANNLTHIQRVGKARMLRVPVPDPLSGEASAARGPFMERLATFKRALQRQLEADVYNVVICLDLLAAAAAAPLLTGANAHARLVIEVGDVPSSSFEKRWPVDGNDTETRRQWDAAERVALKAAALVLVPSRHAARLLSERTDPRHLRVVPRLIDTRVFQPPTVEVALDDVKTVAFLGGREGGSRSLAVASAVKALLGRVPDARVLVLGTPSRAERHLVDDLTRRGLMERVVPVDISDDRELVQALCAAHVVVVPAGAEGDIYGLPHRALEAMACGRAVVVTGAEASYKDAIQNGVQARIAPVLAPDEVAAAIAGLLADEVGRGTLARAGLKQALKHDLALRLPELGQVLTEGCGVAFSALLPPLEEQTAPAAIARAVPADERISGSQPADSAPTVSPLARPAQPLLAPGSLTSVLTPAPPVPDAPRPPAPAPGAPRPRARTMPTAALPPLLSSVASSAPLTKKPRLPSSGSRPQTGGTVVTDDAPSSGGDVWAGDTLLDPLALSPSPSEPPPERVKGAMLITQSGSFERPSKLTSATTEQSSPAPRQSRTTTNPSTKPAGSGGGPRSLSLGMADDNGEDDWSRDTIADASPLAEPTRQPNSSERPPQTHPPRSLLVEAGVGDMTAEDKEPESSSQ